MRVEFNIRLRGFDSGGLCPHFFFLSKWCYLGDILCKMQFNSIQIAPAIASSILMVYYCCIRAYLMFEMVQDGSGAVYDCGVGDMS